MGKPTICIGKNKGAVTAKQISACVFDTWIGQSLFFLHTKCQASSLHSEAVQACLCRTWSETEIVGFDTHRLKSFFSFRNLKYNNLGTISTNIFGGSSTISQSLYLSNNEMTKLSSNAFDNVQINNIYLDNNLIEEFPQALLTQNPVLL